MNQRGRKKSLLISSLKQLPPDQKTEILNQLTDAEAEEILFDWSCHARSNQLPPDGDWFAWLILAGRGFGKTRTGAETVRTWIKQGYDRIALIAETAADCRDVVVEGESGLLACSWKHDRDHKGNIIGVPLYEPSKRRLTWENGAIATTYSGDDPEQLRGPQHSKAWVDELAKYRNAQEMWDNLEMGLRLGDSPQVLISTTPRPIKLLRDLVKDPDVVVTNGSTYDNSANLDGKFFDRLRKKYEGTRTGRQELHAELLDQAEGALWTREMLEVAHHRGDVPEMKRIIVAIDPAASDTEASDETGIVVCGLGQDDKGYVLKLSLIHI